MISHEVRWWYISVVQAHLWPSFRVIHLFFVVFQPLSSGLKKSIVGNGLRKTIPNHTTEWVCGDVGLGIWLNTIKEKSPLNHYWGQENRFPVSKKVGFQWKNIISWNLQHSILKKKFHIKPIIHLGGGGLFDSLVFGLWQRYTFWLSKIE